MKTKTLAYLVRMTGSVAGLAQTKSSPPAKSGRGIAFARHGAHRADVVRNLRQFAPLLFKN